MQEIVASVRRVTSIINEISSASEEQSRGIQQVNQAVSQMDSVTQQNAALVEQAAASAASLETHRSACAKRWRCSLQTGRVIEAESPALGRGAEPALLGA